LSHGTWDGTDRHGEENRCFDWRSAAGADPLEIFKIASKSVWLGSVEAPDEATAIEKAAEEFKTDARRLYARRR
jgi:hypothetical protein